MKASSQARENFRAGLNAGLRETAIAGAFLTRLPFRPSGETTMADVGRAVWAFPLVGLVVGAVAGATLWVAAALNLHPLACAFLALAASALATGALHEDGLADVADGFGGGQTPAQKLRIMRDSHIGSYGVLALIVVTGLKAALLAGLMGPGIAAVTVLAAAVLSRGLLPALMALMPRARSDGLAVAAGRPASRQALLALGIASLLAWPLLGGITGLAAILGGLLSALMMAYIAHRQIGGYSGDVLGATQQIVELTVYMVAGAFAL